MSAERDGQLLITRHCDEDGVVELHLNDPRDKNALSETFVEQLMVHLAALCADQQAKVCVIRGLDEVFCSGGHMDMLTDLAQGHVASSDIMVSRGILEIPVPTIAAMEGHAVGGGLALGLCCDIVLVAKESRYGCSFMNMGFTPGMGTTRILQFAMGEYLAAEMMYGGQFFRGSHFAGRAGVNYVLPRSQVLPKANSVARRIAEKPRFALELLKRSLSLPKRQAFEQARSVEAMMHDICFKQPETLELIRENYAQAPETIRAAKSE